MTDKDVQKVIDGLANKLGLANEQIASLRKEILKCPNCEGKLKFKINSLLGCDDCGSFWISDKEVEELRKKRDELKQENESYAEWYDVHDKQIAKLQKQLEQAKNGEEPMAYLMISEDECQRCKESDKKLGTRCGFHSLIKEVKRRVVAEERERIYKMPIPKGISKDTLMETGWLACIENIKQMFGDSLLQQKKRKVDE